MHKYILIWETLVKCLEADIFKASELK